MENISKTKNLDFTQGSIWKKLIIFVLPILIGNLFQQLYLTVDAIVVGQYTGKAGLAAIDAVNSLIRLPTNFFVGLSTGSTIIISQYFGKKDQEELSKAVHTSIAFAFVAGLFLSILGNLFAPYFLRILAVPEDIFTYSLTYVRVVFAGMMVSLLYNISTGILRAVGDSRTPLIFLMVASILNVVLDILFVGYLSWGVGGAAFATLLAQLVSALLTLRLLMKTDMACKLYFKQIQFHKNTLQKIFSIGLPIALQSSLYPIANMVIQTSVNEMGTNLIASWSLSTKLDFPIWIMLESLGAAVSTFAAQNYGAGLYDRVKKGVNIGLAITLAVVISFSIFLYFASPTLAKLFINKKDHDVIPMAIQFVRFLAPTYFLFVFSEIFSGGIRATGDTFTPMVLTLTGTFAIRLLWMFLIVPKYRTPMVIVASYPISWLVTSLLVSSYFIYFRKRKL